ncbi:MAG: hypothetical protein ACR2KX_16000 [Chitinophagaceae bacterium]
MIFLCLAVLSLTSLGQNDALNSITNRFNNYQQNNLQEKLFIHSDQNLYIAGEILWFKIYCVDAANNKPLDISKVAYVEILDKDQQPVLQAKISLKKGSGNGSLLLPSTLLSGNYILRGYTSLMKNFDAEFYFKKNITIINTFKNESAAQKNVADSNKYDIQFFPEGGYLVNDLQSKVAFRVTDASGKGIDFNGAVIDDKNDTVVQFHPLKFGIGSFNFTPKKSAHYRAVIKPLNNDFITQTLPHVLDNGFVMNVTDAEKESLKINVSTTTTDQSIYLIIHAERQIKVAEAGVFKNGSAEFKIDKNKLADGISYITFIKNKDQPVCERLYFKHPHQQLIINTNADEDKYFTRKKVTINVLAKDETNKPQVADMSVSVFLLDSLQSADDADIYNYLWLSAELKGRIESPGYYFKTNNKETNEALDNLMLTHGWRRFKWEDVLENKKPVLQFLPEYEGHIITGKIVSGLPKNSVENIQGFLSVPGTRFQLYTSKSNADGLMNFYTNNLFGSKILVAQTNTEENSTHHLDILSPFSQTLSSNKIPVFSSSKTLPPVLLQRSINMQVENIYAAGKLNHFQSVKTDTGVFYGKADVKYNLEDYTRFPTMEEVLREYVREVNVREKRNEFFLTIVYKDENQQAVIKNPVVLLDGVPMFDKGNKITHYNALKVKTLEVVKSKYFLGPATFDGIISFFTYNGDLSGFEPDTTATIIDYDALQFKREFYSPVYTIPEQVTSRLPDFRNLLFWSADMLTDAKEKNQVSFFTSDQTGKYAVVLQGISGNGNAGSKVFTIEVKLQQQNR